MSVSIRNKTLTPLELQYAELKKQSVVDLSNSRQKNGSKGGKAVEITDEVTLSLALLVADEQTKREPSQPVTTDEMQALRTQLSFYA